MIRNEQLCRGLERRGGPRRRDQRNARFFKVRLAVLRAERVRPTPVPSVNGRDSDICIGLTHSPWEKSVTCTPHSLTRHQKPVEGQ
jgi:hypothetical protein